MGVSGHEVYTRNSYLALQAHCSCLAPLRFASCTLSGWPIWRDTGWNFSSTPGLGGIGALEKKNRMQLELFAALQVHCSFSGSPSVCILYTVWLAHLA